MLMLNLKMPELYICNYLYKVPLHLSLVRVKYFKGRKTIIHTGKSIPSNQKSLNGAIYIPEKIASILIYFFYTEYIY